MKITPFRPYSTAGTTRAGAFEKSTASSFTASIEEEMRNVDKLDISGGAMRSEIEKTAWAMTQQATRPVSQQRLDSLRDAVRNQTYFVPTDRLVDAMISWRML